MQEHHTPLYAFVCRSKPLVCAVWVCTCSGAVGGLECDTEPYSLIAYATLILTYTVLTPPHILVCPRMPLYAILSALYCLHV